MVRVSLVLDPVSMHLIIDRSGCCQVQERLERGTFQVPAVGPDGLPRRELTPTALGFILEGVDLHQRARCVRFHQAQA
ncbi:transposase [Myxococcota bacterium]|nr:transposase [Myxococcota bacterium]